MAMCHVQFGDKITCMSDIIIIAAWSVDVHSVCLHLPVTPFVPQDYSDYESSQGKQNDSYHSNCASNY